MDTRDIKTVTIKELAQAFNDKYANISPMDRYGI